MTGRPAISAFGDAAILIDLEPEEASAGSATRKPDARSAGGATLEAGGAALLAMTAAAQALAARIRSATAAEPGFGAVVPAAASVLVHLDHARGSTTIDVAIDVVRRIVDGLEEAASGWPSGGSILDIPVRYGGADGPDLESVAALSGLSQSQVMELHSSAVYRVLFLGFAPGFGYLGPLPAALVLPRRASPRIHVPPGSVAIAGQHTAIYPVGSPGGWHLLGRTSVPMWDPQRSPPAVLEPGGLVRFVSERPP